MSVEPDPRTSIRALLFSDVENSTALGEQLGPTRTAELWAVHDRRARDLLESHDGHQIGRGDGVLLLFDDTVRATRYALDYQAAVASLGLATRVAIHVGPVTLRANPGQRRWCVSRPDDLTEPAFARQHSSIHSQYLIALS